MNLDFCSIFEHMNCIKSPACSLEALERADDQLKVAPGDNFFLSFCNAHGNPSRWRIFSSPF